MWFRRDAATPRAPEWRKVRRTFLKAHPACAACGTVHLVDVHHVVPFHVDRTLELDPANLLTLCRWRRHHFRIGHFGDWSRWNERAREDAATELARRTE